MNKKSTLQLSPLFLLFNDLTVPFSLKMKQYSCFSWVSLEFPLLDYELYGRGRRITAFRKGIKLKDCYMALFDCLEDHCVLGGDSLSGCSDKSTAPNVQRPRYAALPIIWTFFLSFFVCAQNYA